MKQGTCGLCLQTADLQDSHLLASGFYKLLRAPALKNPNPITIRRGIAVATSQEVRKHFLCAVCEDRLNNSGERWVLQNCFQGKREFPLHEMLTKDAPAYSLDDMRIFAAGVESRQIEYFALSVFWRAAATDWKWRDHTIKLELGPYEERLREYLLKGGTFPENVYLQVVIASPAGAKLISLQPYAARFNGMRTFRFAVPGMAFSMIAASHTPAVYKEMLLAPSAQPFIGVSDVIYSKWIHMLGRVAQTAQPKRSLKGFLNGPRPSETFEDT